MQVRWRDFVSGRLFTYWVFWETAVHCGTVENPIRVMEHEHESAGSALQRIRELTSNYQAPADGCASFTALYDGLSCLESDLHLHIHKENNILFPRAAALESALMSAKA